MDEVVLENGQPQDKSLIQKVEEILTSNQKQRGVLDPLIEKVRRSYLDQFWTVARDTAGFELTHPVSDTSPVNIQVNYLSGFIATHQAGLTYGQVTPDVQAAPQVPVEPEAADAIRRLCDQWINSVGVAERTTQVVVLSLLEGEAAYLLTVRDDDNERVPPMDRIALDVVARGDLLIDRDSKSWELSYIGFTREETTFGDSAQERVPKKKKYACIFDFDGTSTVTLPPPAGAEGTPPVTEGTTLGDEYEGDEKPEIPGRYVEACLQRQAPTAVDKITKDSVIPDNDCYGRPIAPIVPVLLTPDPRYPYRGHPSSLRAYAIVEPKNQLTTWQLRAAQKDMARTITVDADQLEEEAVGKFCQGNLDQILKKKPLKSGQPVPNGEPIQYVTAPMVPSTVSELDKNLEAIRQSTQGLSPLTRGEQLDYATATEVTASVEYSEAALSPMRRCINARLCDLLRLFLRVLARVLEESGQVSLIIADAAGKPIEIQLSWLAHPWNITLKDGNVTPLADEKRRAVFEKALPNLTELLQMREQAMAPQQLDPTTGQSLGPPPSYLTAAFAETAYEYIVQINRLPADFKLDALKAKAAMLTPTPGPAGGFLGGVGRAVPPQTGQPPLDNEEAEAAGLQDELGPEPEF